MDPGNTERPSRYIPKQIFHTALEIIDYSKSASEPRRAVYILQTHGALEAAKGYAVNSLETLNFTPDDFYQYFARLGKGYDNEGWTKGDGVFVFARTFMAQELYIRIHTTPNHESLASTLDGKIIFPSGVTVLHYVLKIVDYDDHPSSGLLTEVQGAYLHYGDACTAAHKCLDKTKFIEYNTLWAAHFPNQSQFDSDVAVHAVSKTGRNYFVAVKTPPKHKCQLKNRDLKI